MANIASRKPLESTTYHGAAGPIWWINNHTNHIYSICECMTIISNNMVYDKDKQNMWIIFHTCHNNIYKLQVTSKFRTQDHWLLTNDDKFLLDCLMIGISRCRTVSRECNKQIISTVGFNPLNVILSMMDKYIQQCGIWESNPTYSLTSNNVWLLTLARLAPSMPSTEQGTLPKAGVQNGWRHFQSSNS